ncbi:MarR family winged helix-turn-helix transcriptional regulator [Amycolatopsis silviterrae]|uniref:MarR family winged helix-turn-helix transcriptional regulator n=1 Tax=Amycolatopsis silviterrae TaxID=1656914 RepID=A0ABW5HCI0_9PSEU
MTPDDWELWNAWVHAQRLLTRELDRGLQRECGITKTEFSVLVTLWRTPGHELRVANLVEALGWEKSRVSHQLTRMEARDLVAPARSASGRRTGVSLTSQGRSSVQDALVVHGNNIRRHFLDSLTPAQTSAIRSWAEQTIERIEPGR